MHTISIIQQYLKERESGFTPQKDDEEEDPYKPQFVPTNGTNSRASLHIDTGPSGAKTEKKVHKAKFISFSPSKSTLAPHTPAGPPIFILALDDNFKGIERTNDGVPNKDLRKKNASRNKSLMSKNKDNFQSKQTLNFIENGVATGRNEASNMSILINKDVNQNYSTLNESYKNKIKEKLGNSIKHDNVFTGGGMRNDPEFLLPQIEDG